jgi:hypothetical protein
VLLSSSSNTGKEAAGQSMDYFDYNEIINDDYKITTRRGLIKIQVIKLEEEIIQNLSIKTFNLALNETIFLNKNLKLGEKLTEIRLERLDRKNVSVLKAQLTIFFLMNNEDLHKQIFYLFNQDGSLYLIKKLNFNLRQTFIFNLAIQVTNML